MAILVECGAVRKVQSEQYTLSREQEAEVLDRGSAILEGLTGQSHVLLRPIPSGLA